MRSKGLRMLNCWFANRQKRLHRNVMNLAIPLETE